jgi:glucosamine-6-phosphate deaminase
MRIAILRSAEDASAAVARVIADAVRTMPDLVLGLPTGRTPELVYDELAALHRHDRLSFRRVSTFNLDEFCGIGARDPRSYHAFMRRHFFDRVDHDPARRFILNGARRDWRREVRRFDRALAQAGGLDVCLLGIGRNGHLGFNEPAATLQPRTHRVRLLPETRRSNAHLFGGDWRAVPREALSMGIGAILGARVVILLATGKTKASVVRRALTGPITTRLPASLLQAHPHALVVLDKNAAGELRRHS